MTMTGNWTGTGNDEGTRDQEAGDRIVFAFDRDWTVDVNPHPHHEAVPLEWVRHLAHDTRHAVYAIGNQDLAEEAGIPGVVDIVGRHPDDWDRWLGEKQPDGRYERFPSRRDRLALIDDLHRDASRCIVVDDLDLGDVDGWEHYHAWEFVPLAREGEIDPALPWVRDAVTDGGRPSSAGITPDGPDHLASFLDDYGDAPGFELTFSGKMGDGGEQRSQLLADIRFVRRTRKRPSARPSVKCVPIGPTAEPFSLPVEVVDHVATVDPDPDMFTAGAETPVETAVGLRRLAGSKPDAVQVATVLALLEAEDRPAQQERAALQALTHVAAVRPADCTPALPIIRGLLEGEQPEAPGKALGVLRAITEAAPAAVAPLVSVIVPYLDTPSSEVRREAAHILSNVAAEFPEDVTDAVPGLATIVEEGHPGQTHAVYVFSRVADEHPEAVKPVTDTLATVVGDDSRSDSVRLNATGALGRVVGEYPSVGVDIVDDAIELLDADNHKLRNNAIGLITDVALVHTDVVEPHIETIAPLLTADDTYTRINASGALSRVAEDFPESVREVTGEFLELLTDDSPAVRENACWGLGYLQATEAEDDLQRRVREDDSENVRSRASWALSRLDG
jgi:HEAT repeat protein